MIRYKIALLGLIVVLTGCSNSIWHKVDRSETEASRYGTVTAGAPRVSDYDNVTLEASRERLRETIRKLRLEVDTALKPEVASAQWSERARYLKLGVDLGSILKLPTPDKDVKQEQGSNGNAPAADKNGSTPKSLDSLKDLLKDINVEPNRIDAQIYKLSVLRFLESELDSLNLSLSTPVDSIHYRRVQVSVSLTAWTTLPAVSALVYLDLYPFNGDWWCHDAVKRSLNEKAKRNENENGFIDISNHARNELEKTFSRVVPLTTADLHTWVDDPPSDPYTSCHRWLTTNHLVPKLVHVEPLGDSRYVMLSQGEETAHDIGLDVNAGTHGNLRSGQKGSDSGLTKNADIRLTAISFSAGERRAGWFFRGDTESKTMRPLERRLRMVVDIPRDLTDLELHVHKAFLDKNNINLASFSEQTKDLHGTRWLIDDIEHDVDGKLGTTQCEQAIKSGAVSQRETCYPSETYWQLTKSRVRNLLSLGWSERLIVHIPDSESELRTLQYALRANVVSPDIQNGFANQFLIIDGDRIKEIVKKESAVPDGYLRVEDFSEDYVYPGFIDTHNHPHYNFIPQWIPTKSENPPNPCKPYCNRYEWQNEDDYKLAVKGAYDKLDTSGFGIDGLKYGHLRALAGGATTIQGAEDPGSQPTQLRTLWKHSASNTKKVADLQASNRLAEYKDALEKHTIKRLFLHVSEGTDAASKSELAVLESTGLLRPDVVLIHAIPFGPEEFDKIKTLNVPLVWSPRSNLALYGQTMDIKKVLDLNIAVALAPDWTVTGSSNMLQELKCAQEYAKANGLESLLTPIRLYRMVTETAARIAGLEEGGKLLAGQLTQNTYADFVVIKKKDPDPFKNLLAATEEDIRLVVIGGQPVLGEPKFFNLISGNLPVDYVDIGNSVKAVRLGPNQKAPATSENIIPTIQHHLIQSWPLAPIIESPLKSCSVQAKPR